MALSTVKNKKGSKKEQVHQVPLLERVNPAELKRQGVLLVWATVFVIYGIIFYYLPLGGWIMAFQNFKIKKGLFH